MVSKFQDLAAYERNMQIYANHMPGDAMTGAIFGLLDAGIFKSSPTQNIISSAAVSLIGSGIGAAMGEKLTAGHFLSSMLTTTAVSMATYYAAHGLMLYQDKDHNPHESWSQKLAAQHAQEACLSR